MSGIVCLIIVIVVVAAVVKYCIDMNNTPDSGFCWGRQGFLPKNVQDEWQGKVWKQIEREKKAKERREKTKRYYDGYDD